MKDFHIQNQSYKNLHYLKIGVWLYFVLLIFEGALRKWFLPGFSAPLLIIRDPVAIWLLIMGWKWGYFKPNLFTFGMMTVGLLGLITALVFGHNNITIAIYGARIFLLHFPVIFVIGQVFDKKDVIKMGRVLLWIAIPMTVLIAFQFYSPQSTWINRGVGGDIEGAGFSGALGYFRPPGTFSFTTGNSQFFGLTSSFIFYFLLHPSKISKPILILAIIGLLVAIPLSISRTLLFMVVISALFAFSTVFIAAKRKRIMGRMTITAIAAVLAILVLSSIPFFQTATEVFTARFENASNVEGGLQGTLGERYLGGLLSAFEPSPDLPFFGYGIGLGTNVGSQLLTGGRSFLIAEDEWPRLIGELGLFMGSLAIFIRLALCIYLSRISYLQGSLGNILPWMLLSFGLIIVPQGQWAQPTTLGFGILSAGLIIAAFNTRKTIDKVNLFMRY